MGARRRTSRDSARRKKKRTTTSGEEKGRGGGPRILELGGEGKYGRAYNETCPHLPWHTSRSVIPVFPTKLEANGNVAYDRGLDLDERSSACFSSMQLVRHSSQA